MQTAFTIPYPMLRDVLDSLRRRPYHVAVGSAGLSVRDDAVVEVLARDYSLVHEGALRSSRTAAGLRFEVGYVPYSFWRPGVWEAAAFAAQLERTSSSTPACVLLLGGGSDRGLFTGILMSGDRTVPVEWMNVPGAGMHRLRAVDFLPQQARGVTREEAERWSRLVGALGGVEVWQRLVALRFCIVGAGRTGSLAAATLVRQGIREIVLIDPDRLELHNLDAMDAVTRRDLDRPKAAAIAENLGREFPHARITALIQSASGKEARSYLKQADVVLCGVDNGSARLLVGAQALCYGKPLLDIGTGVLHTPIANDPESNPAIGADVRLLLPGDGGCLLCRGGVPGLGMERRELSGAGRQPWQDERAGSLRTLNAMAVHAGLFLIEQLAAGRLRQSTWLRIETGPGGVPVLNPVESAPVRSCRLCALRGAGDFLPRTR